MTHARHLFVSLPVRDLAASKAFFARLGFAFNPQFTDDKAANMIVGDASFVMLLSEAFFATLTTKQQCVTATHAEMAIGVSAASRADVDAMVQAAIAGGGAQAAPAEDHGFMYSSSFHDLDGHNWEVMWMDPAALAPAP
jgi:hypothetical protein